MNKLDQKIDNFLNLDHTDLDDYYKNATIDDIDILRKILQGYAYKWHSKTKILESDDEEILRKVKALGIFYTNNNRNMPCNNNKYTLFRKSCNKFYFYISPSLGKCIVFMKFYRILKEMDRIKRIADFPLTCYNHKFVPKESNYTDYKLLGMCYKKGYTELAFISYY